VGETSIDDIVRNSGVAKGTFYLYFKNKTEILTEIVMEKSLDIIKAAYDEVRGLSSANPEDDIVTFIDILVDQLGEDIALLELISKNLSWGLYKRVMSESTRDETLKEIKTQFTQSLRDIGAAEREADKVLFIIIELASSICYSAIILREPAPMAEMKPILLDAVRRIVSKRRSEPST
jgi:AcrR family transcriptional regulator